MQATKFAPVEFPGYVPSYYPGRLQGDELSELRVWAKQCRLGDTPAELLSAYVHCLISFEQERRAAIEDGSEILEVQMPPLPAHAWSDSELAAALVKTSSIAFSTEGEIQTVFRKLNAAVVAEVAYRMGRKD